MHTLRLILASASPRRLELLRQAGLTPHVHPSGVHEQRRPGEPPDVLVRRLAEEKARAVARALPPGDPPCIVLGADTEVVVDDRSLGKPDGDAEAVAMLELLRGREHEVLTGVFLLRTDDARTSGGVERTRLHFRAYDDAVIRAYVATGEPLGKAGAYAIQGRGAALARRIEGSWTNVVGLPLEPLPDWLESLGVELAGWIGGRTL